MLLGSKLHDVRFLRCSEVLMFAVCIGGLVGDLERSRQALARLSSESSTCPTCPTITFWMWQVNKKRVFLEK